MQGLNLKKHIVRGIVSPEKFQSQVGDGEGQYTAIAPEYYDQLKKYGYDPAVHDWGDPATMDRIYNQRLGEMTWQDLLKASFQEEAGQMGTPDLPVFNNLVRRIEATGWTDEQKRQAIINAADQHFAQHGQLFTGWSPEEGVAGMLGIPDYNPAAHAKAQDYYSQAHSAYSEGEDERSLMDAIRLGSVLLGPILGMAGAYGSPTGMEAGAAGAFDVGGMGAAESMSLGAGYTSPVANYATNAAPWGVNARPISVSDWAANAEASELLQGTQQLNNAGFNSYEEFLRSLPQGTEFRAPSEQEPAPVEERGRPHDPKSLDVPPDPVNLINGVQNLGMKTLSGTVGMPTGTTGASTTYSSLAQIKDALGLTSSVGSFLEGLRTPSVGETGTTLARASDSGRRRVVQQNLDEVNRAFSGFDDAYFASIADAFKNYYAPTVNEQFDTAQRNLIYAAPGGVGSSNFARQLSEAERDRQRASTDIADSAQSEAQRARANVEGTKANLLGLAETSEDPAAVGAQAVAGAQAASYTPEYSAVGDLVSRYTSLANAAGGLERAGYGRQTVRPISFGGGGSRSSVRTVS